MRASPRASVKTLGDDKFFFPTVTKLLRDKSGATDDTGNILRMKPTGMKTELGA